VILEVQYLLLFILANGGEGTLWAICRESGWDKRYQIDLHHSNETKQTHYR